MPATVSVAAFVFGIVFLLAALVGQDLEIAAVKIPALGGFPRAIVGVAGVVLIYVGFFDPFNHSSTPVLPTPVPQPTTSTPVLPTPVPQPTTSTPVLPTPVPPTPMLPPTALPEGFHRLEESIYGRFDPNVPGDVALDAGRIYRFMDERTGRYCRAEFPPNGLIWVLCIKIGEPEPTQIPPTPTRIPSIAIPPTQILVTSVTYRVDIVNISLEQMKTLPGCENPLAGNNVCIVGPGEINLELYNYQEKATYGPIPTDAHQLYIREENSTRITIVSDQSGLPVITIGNNELVPELGQYYKIVVKKVE